MDIITMRLDDLKPYSNNTKVVLRSTPRKRKSRFESVLEYLAYPSSESCWGIFVNLDMQKILYIRVKLYY